MHTSSVLHVKTRHSNLRIWGRKGRATWSASSSSFKNRLISHLPLGWWPRSVLGFLPQSSIRQLPRAHARWYLQYSRDKVWHLPHMQHCAHRWNVKSLGSVRSKRQITPVGSFLMCAVPLSVFLNYKKILIKVHWKLLSVLHRKTTLLYFWSAISSSIQIKTHSPWFPKRGSQLKWDKDYSKWWHKPQKKTCLTNECSSF